MQIAHTRGDEVHLWDASLKGRAGGQHSTSLQFVSSRHVEDAELEALANKLRCGEGGMANLSEAAARSLVQYATSPHAPHAHPPNPLAPMPHPCTSRHPPVFGGYRYKKLLLRPVDEMLTAETIVNSAPIINLPRPPHQEPPQLPPHSMPRAPVTSGPMWSGGPPFMMPMGPGAGAGGGANPPPGLAPAPANPAMPWGWPSGHLVPLRMPIDGSSMPTPVPNAPPIPVPAGLAKNPMQMPMAYGSMPPFGGMPPHSMQMPPHSMQMMAPPAPVQGAPTLPGSSQPVMCSGPGAPGVLAPPPPPAQAQVVTPVAVAVAPAQQASRQQQQEQEQRLQSAVEALHAQHQQRQQELKDVITAHTARPPPRQVTVPLPAELAPPPVEAAAAPEQADAPDAASPEAEEEQDDMQEAGSATVEEEAPPLQEAPMPAEPLHMAPSVPSESVEPAEPVMEPVSDDGLELSNSPLQWPASDAGESRALP